MLVYRKLGDYGSAMRQPAMFAPMLQEPANAALQRAVSAIPPTFRASCVHHKVCQPAPHQEGNAITTRTGVHVVCIGRAETEHRCGQGGRALSDEAKSVQGGGWVDVSGLHI